MIAIIDYNVGNIRSVKNAFQRLGQEVILTADHEEILSADRVLLPGVGDASWAMTRLKERRLDQLIPTLRQPVMGICLGLQLMCEHSEEGDTQCMDIFSAKVKKFPAKGVIPHMGWNNISECKGAIFDDTSADKDLYFVHSYYAELCEETSAVCDYLLPFSAALARDNFFATQFHPEKSADVGNRILQNFLAI